MIQLVVCHKLFNQAPSTNHFFNSWFSTIISKAVINMYMHRVFSPPLDDFLRRTSQKWDECLNLSCFGEGETMTGQIFLPPPPQCPLLWSLTRLQGAVTSGGRRGTGLSQAGIPHHPSHTSQRCSISLIWEIKCGIPSKALCILTVAKTLGKKGNWATGAP